MFCLALYLPRAFVSGLRICIPQKPLLVRALGLPTTIPGGKALVGYRVWRKEGEKVTEPTNNERSLKDLSLDESGAYVDEIDAMSLEELEDRLPEAQQALEAIEAKLEELMGLRDAALICAAAMTARLAALKQKEVGPERGRGEANSG